MLITNNNLHQSHCHSESAHHGTQARTPSQSATLSGISQFGTDTLSTHVDKNCNPHPINCTSSLATPALVVSHPSTPPPQGSNPQNSPNIFNYSPRSTHTHNHRSCEKFCQNCQNELPDDLDITLPSPVYFYDFLSECPSPWLHYGYCKPCLEVARYKGADISHHIAQCPAFVDQCWDGEHEDIIEHYKNTESETHALHPSLSLSSNQEAHTPETHSNTSSPGPYYRTNPDEYCQNCKSEISEEAEIQLPCPVQYFDFITECPTPWLHYGYCTPCLEVARRNNTDIIIEHITQCEALSGQCWEGEHENHIEHYKHTEDEIAKHLIAH